MHLFKSLKTDDCNEKTIVESRKQSKTASILKIDKSKN